MAIQSETAQEIPMYELMGLESKLQDKSVSGAAQTLESTPQSSATSPQIMTQANILAQATSASPAEFSWLNNNGNWMTPVKNQGVSGMCQTFSAMGGVEAGEKITSKDLNYNPDLSEQEILCKGIVDYYPCSTVVGIFQPLEWCKSLKSRGRTSGKLKNV